MKLFSCSLLQRAGKVKTIFSILGGLNIKLENSQLFTNVNKKQSYNSSGITIKHETWNILGHSIQPSSTEYKYFKSVLRKMCECEHNLSFYFPLESHMPSYERWTFLRISRSKSDLYRWMNECMYFRTFCANKDLEGNSSNNLNCRMNENGKSDKNFKLL